MNKQIDPNSAEEALSSKYSMNFKHVNDYFLKNEKMIIIFTHTYRYIN